MPIPNKIRSSNIKLSKPVVNSIFWSQVSTMWVIKKWKIFMCLMHWLKVLIDFWSQAESIRLNGLGQWGANKNRDSNKKHLEIIICPVVRKHHTFYLIQTATATKTIVQIMERASGVKNKDDHRHGCHKRKKTAESGFFNCNLWGLYDQLQTLDKWW